MKKLKPAANAFMGTALFLCVFVIGCLAAVLAFGALDVHGQLAWTQRVLAVFAVLLTGLCVGTSRSLLQLDEARFQIESLEFQMEAITARIDQTRETALDALSTTYDLKKKLGE